MGLLISCYDSCWGVKVANGESINPYPSVSDFFILENFAIIIIFHSTGPKKKIPN